MSYILLVEIIISLKVLEGNLSISIEMYIQDLVFWPRIPLLGIYPKGMPPTTWKLYMEDYMCSVVTE